MSTRQLKLRIDLLENRLIEHQEMKFKSVEATIQSNTLTVQNDIHKLDEKSEKKFEILQNQNKEILKLLENNHNQIQEIIILLKKPNVN